MKTRSNHRRPSLRPALPASARAGALALATTALVAIAPAAFAAPIAVSPPNIDRWMYPFNSQAANRPTAPVFTTLGFTSTDRFDDRDAEYLVGFATSAIASPGAAPSSYRVRSVRLRAMVTVPQDDLGTPQTFVYDATQDALCTYSGSCTDADPGRPIELFAAGYRGRRNPSSPLWGPTTFVQNSPFASQSPIFAPAQGNRNVYPIDFDGAATPRDVSNNVSGTPQAGVDPNPPFYGPAFEVTPLAVAQARGVYNLGSSLDDAPDAPPPAPGAAVADRTDFEFAIDLDLPGVRAYVQQGLALGQLNFVVTSLHPAPNMGQGAVSYPIFFTRFNAFGVPARLIVELDSACNPADIADNAANPGPDGAVDNGDFQLFIAQFFSSASQSACTGQTIPCVAADIADNAANPSPDGFIDNGDFQLFVASFFTASCP
jgi:hypothetical protein